MSAVPERFRSMTAPNITTSVGFAAESPLHVAVRRALAVLGEGGCPDCKCAGCSAEMAEAHRILREAIS